MPTIEKIKSDLKKYGFTKKLPTKKSELESLLLRVINKEITIDEYLATKKTPSKSSTTKKKSSSSSKSSSSLSVPELKNLLKEKGITKVIPKLKPSLIAFANADTCSPLEGSFCKIGEVCDLRNNICLDPKYITGKVLTKSFGKYGITGQKDNVNEVINILGKTKVDEVDEETVMEKEEDFGNDEFQNYIDEIRHVSVMKEYVSKNDVKKLLDNVFKIETKLKEPYEIKVDEDIIKFLEL